MMRASNQCVRILTMMNFMMMSVGLLEGGPDAFPDSVVPVKRKNLFVKDYWLVRDKRGLEIRWSNCNDNYFSVVYSYPRFGNRFFNFIYSRFVPVVRVSKGGGVHLPEVIPVIFEDFKERTGIKADFSFVKTIEDSKVDLLFALYCNFFRLDADDFIERFASCIPKDSLVRLLSKIRSCSLM